MWHVPITQKYLGVNIGWCDVFKKLSHSITIDHEKAYGCKSIFLLFSTRDMGGGNYNRGHLSTDPHPYDCQVEIDNSWDSASPYAK